MTVHELVEALGDADSNADVEVYIPLPKKGLGLVKSVVDVRTKVIDSIVYLNVDGVNKIQEEQLLPKED